MSWYSKIMPTVKDVLPVLPDICAQIKKIKGVDDVYLWGSLLQHLNDPNYTIKNIDIIASTSFDSGDLLAIDNGRYSPLRMRSTDLEDEGFNPDAVNFTKNYMTYQQYNVNHWALSKDKVLLHWGTIPETHDDWIELHEEAEKAATETTGMKRCKLFSATDEKRKEWKVAFDYYMQKHLSKSSGWFASNEDAAVVLEKAIKQCQNS